MKIDSNDESVSSQKDEEETTESEAPESDAVDEAKGMVETIQRFLTKTFGDLDGLNGIHSQEPETPTEDVTKGISDPGVRAQVKARESLIVASRNRLLKRKEELRREYEESDLATSGEIRSTSLAQRVEMIPLDQILPDPNFENLRLKAQDEELTLLYESIKHEGLKVPIIVVEAGKGLPGFHVRAGFRRTEVIRRLGWKHIFAVVLPANTPISEEYWTNIIENSARSRLSTYEIASSAKTMRDKFRVKAADFGRRAGYDEKYIQNLLRCIDRLPEEIIGYWKEKKPIPLSLYTQWAGLTQEEATKQLHIYVGRNPQIVKGWRPASLNERTKERNLTLKVASARGLARMQQVRFAVEVARCLDSKTRDLCIKMIDFCSGARNDVPGIFDLDKKTRMYKSRRRQDLVMPVPDELIPDPTHEEDDPDDKKREN